jgi:hypothetical protein
MKFLDTCINVTDKYIALILLMHIQRGRNINLIYAGRIMVVELSRRMYHNRLSGHSVI